MQVTETRAKVIVAQTGKKSPIARNPRNKNPINVRRSVFIPTSSPHHTYKKFIRTYYC